MRYAPQLPRRPSVPRRWGSVPEIFTVDGMLDTLSANRIAYTVLGSFQMTDIRGGTLHMTVERA